MVRQNRSNEAYPPNRRYIGFRVDGGHGGSCPGLLTSDAETGRARELQHKGRSYLTYDDLAHQQQVAQVSGCDQSDEQWLLFRSWGDEGGEGKESWKGLEKWVGSSFLLMGIEGVPMRRGKSLRICLRLTVCLFFANKTSGIRPALPWISETLKCLNPNSILRWKQGWGEGSRSRQPLSKTTYFKSYDMNKTLPNQIKGLAHQSAVGMLWVPRGKEGVGGRNWEIGIDIYTLLILCIK